ncbi:MAG: MFS transporter [Actinomycetota bacterium]
MTTAPTGFAVLRHREFRLYVAARFLSSVALMMLGVAVGWQVYALTGDALALGFVGLAQFAPAFLLTLPGGQTADRFDRRRILQVAMAVEVVAALGLLAFALEPAPPVAGIYAILVVMGSARAFIAPASQSLVPLLVGPELFPRAVAINSTAWQSAVIAGPALGGLLYAAGAAVVYGVAAALLAASMLMVARLKARLAVVSDRPKGLDGLLEGVRFVWRRKDILGAISLDLFAVLLGGATALLPIYAGDILHTGPLGLGLLRSAPAVGAAAMAVWLAHHPLQRRAGHTLFIAVAIFGLATIAFGVSTWFPLSLAALVVLGAADMISVVVRQTLVQIETPDAMRGRVSAVNLVFIGASNELGEFESGVTAAWLGTVPAVVIGGLGTLAVAAIWAWKFPALRRIDKLS